MYRYDLSDFLSIRIDFKLNLKKKNKSVLNMISIHPDFVFHNNTSYEISKGNRDFIIIILVLFLFLVHLFHLQNHIILENWKKKIIKYFHTILNKSGSCGIFLDEVVFIVDYEQFFNSTLSLKISFWCILMGVICGSFNKVWLEMLSNTMFFLPSSSLKSILGWHLRSTPEIIQNYGLNFKKVVQFYFHLFFIYFTILFSI